MDPNKQKEQFNVAYVNALAAQAGINNGRTDVDDDSVDVFLVGRGYTGKIRNPQIQLQLKCTSQDFVSGKVLKFPLSRKNYDDLRGDNILCPRYLVVLVVPKDAVTWIEHDDNGMIMRHTCYWVSIRNHPASEHQTITVDVPLSQRLTSVDLRSLMLQASQGEF